MWRRSTGCSVQSVNDRRRRHDTALVDFEETIVRLRATSFWVRESTIEEIRQRLRSVGL